MDISELPLWAIFLVTTLLIAIAIEIGLQLGRRVSRDSEDEKESPVSAITGTVLALLAFMLAFTFGIVADRYDSRKALVREQAITISTAYARTDFLPQPDSDQSKELFHTYMDSLLAAGDPGNVDDLPGLIAQLDQINSQLWDIGVVNARLDPQSEMFGLYMDSLNSVGDVQAIRVAVAVQAKLPGGIWAALTVLVFLAMIAVGYQTAIARSRRSWVLVVLALSFATVVTLIAVLDNPESGYLRVSQQPLIDVQRSMQPDQEPAS